VEIRLGGKQDWPFVYALSKSVMADSVSPWRKQDLDQTVKYRDSMLRGFWRWIEQTGSKVLIAEENGQAVGYLILYLDSREELTGLLQGWVMDFAVLQEWRGRGIGKALLQAAEDYCRGEGLGYLGLAVTSHNSRALKLYQDFGFAEERKLMVKVLE